MADADKVTKLAPPLPLPDSITVSATPDIRMTPNEIRRLKAETGKTLTDLMGEESDDADRMQALVWLQLTREGHELSWDQAGDIAIRYETEAPPDPTSGGS